MSESHFNGRVMQRTKTEAATEAHRRHAAERAVSDPVKLAKAVRIVRLALERGRLSLADLSGE